MQQPIIDFIRAHQRLAITSHQRPDGDSIGSELALFLALKQLGKTLTVLNSDPTPEVFGWLPGAEAVHRRDRLSGQWDGIVILECSSFQRTGLKNLDRYFTINIDHHPGCPHYADLNWVDPSAAAVGLLVEQLIEGLGLAVTPEIATNLYVAVLTDTGSFQHSNTTEESLRAAAGLVARGADPARISQRIYLSEPIRKLELLQRALQTLVVHPGGQIASMQLSRIDLQETGCTNQHTEGLVHYPLSLQGVRAAVFAREAADGSLRVSLRSKGACDVGAAARSLGGGGHRNASGVTLQSPFDQAWPQILRTLQKAVRESDP